MANRKNARDRLLDAAEARLLAGGRSGLVLDAVAADASISKGGLLYHFPSKEKLVEALVDRMVERFDRIQDALVGDENEPGSRARAYLRSTVTRSGQPADGSAKLLASILACVGTEGPHLDALKIGFGRWRESLELDGIDPVRAHVVRLAADGLWLSSLLGFSPLDRKLGKRVIEALEELTREP